jgi:hypothetical protein
MVMDVPANFYWNEKAGKAGLMMKRREFRVVHKNGTTGAC